MSILHCICTSTKRIDGRVCALKEDGFTVWDMTNPENPCLLKVCNKDIISLQVVKSYADQLTERRAVLTSLRPGEKVIRVYLDNIVYHGEILSIESDYIALKLSDYSETIIPIMCIEEVYTTADRTVHVRRRTRDEILVWCRENAPEAAKDLPDDELFDLMKNAYDEAH